MIRVGSSWNYSSNDNIYSKATKAIRFSSIQITCHVICCQLNSAKIRLVFGIIAELNGT